MVTSVGWPAEAVGREELLSWRRKVESRHVSVVWQCIAMLGIEIYITQRGHLNKFVCMPGNLQDVCQQTLCQWASIDESPHHRWRQLTAMLVCYTLHPKHRQTSLTFLQKNEERGELPWAGQMNVATRDTRGQHPAQLVTRCQPRHMRPVTSWPVPCPGLCPDLDRYFCCL